MKLSLITSFWNCMLPIAMRGLVSLDKSTFANTQLPLLSPIIVSISEEWYLCRVGISATSVSTIDTSHTLRHDMAQQLTDGIDPVDIQLSSHGFVSVFPMGDVKDATKVAISVEFHTTGTMDQAELTQRVHQLLRVRCPYVAPGSTLAIHADFTLRVTSTAPRNGLVRATASTVCAVSQACASAPAASSDTSPPQDMLAHIKQCQQWEVRDPTQLTDTLTDALLLPLSFPHLFTSAILPPVTGALISGPSGSGKSHIVRCVARRCHARLITLTASEVESAQPGVSEAILRSAFLCAQNPLSHTAPDPAFQIQLPPCPQQGGLLLATILALDNLEAICPRRGVESGTAAHDTRVVTQLLTLMNGIGGPAQVTSAHRVFVIGTTRDPHALDPALRRPGRFDLELAIPPPSPSTRLAILRSLTAHMPLSQHARDHTIPDIARSTHGFVAADLVTVCQAAAMRVLLADHADASAIVTTDHLKFAIAHTTPSVTSKSDISLIHPPPLIGDRALLKQGIWAKLGGLDDVRAVLERAIEWPLTRTHDLQRFGISSRRGVLLYGPPGCAKTTVVRSACAAAGLTLVTCSVASLYSQYVGETEREIRRLFSLARRAAPVVVFLDEIDTITGSRDFGGASRSADEEVSNRALSTLLNEMDGVGVAGGAGGGQLVVVAATNRPWAVDPALLRPGRFDDMIYVGPPSETARVEILKAQCEGLPMHSSVDLAAIARQCTACSGADMENLCREAALSAMRRGDTQVAGTDFAECLQALRPSLRAESLLPYARFQTRSMS